MKQRQVGIELLRIISMMMVLGLHANFMGIGVPSPDKILSGPEILQVLMQSLCIVAVNVFVMISGWFGIRPSVKGFCNFMWQVIFMVGAAYCVEAVFFHQPVGMMDIMKVFGLFYGGGWFVGAYIGLYILSPILNNFVETASKRQIITTLSAFFIFQFLWGDTLSTAFIACGYSTFSFIGLYILAGCLRRLHLNGSIVAIIAFTVINAALYIAASWFNMIGLRDIVLNYINPLVIAEASAMLLLFAGITISHTPICQSCIKFIAKSCFAAYLLHVALSMYCEGADAIYTSFSGLSSFAMIVVYIIAVFLAAVVIDQPRKLIWRHILLPIIEKNA